MVQGPVPPTSCNRATITALIPPVPQRPGRGLRGMGETVHRIGLVASERPEQRHQQVGQLVEVLLVNATEHREVIGSCPPWCGSASFLEGAAGFGRGHPGRTCPASYERPPRGNKFRAPSKGRRQSHLRRSTIGTE